MAGQLRVAVIGSETRHPDNPHLAYTVYRTSINYQGLCYHRLIRFRQFRSFAKRLKLASNATRILVKLPPKIWWSRKASLQPETVEARQVLLNEFMQQVSTCTLTPRSAEELLKLLQVGAFAPDEEEDRVINSRMSLKQQSAALTEPTSDILDPNHSLQSEVSHQQPANSQNQHQDSVTEEEEEPSTAEQVQNVPNCLLSARRQGNQASPNTGYDDTKTRGGRSMSDPLPLVQQRRTCPVSTSLTSPNMKHVMFGSSTDFLACKEGGRDSTGSSSDLASTPERHYFCQIKQCIASIENLVDSSRKFEAHICEKQTADRSMGAGPISDLHR
ncbi:unnamed protein product [Peronospora belbahrii]|uniref:PX domain-containing protein n=1 Tax=Peronospora belbahrii TaxID=622444 RepID=A0AAU9KMC1_9STRA|nr:unnamed protein product [Peronospora belbahrii]CAH0515280.1 unnamed protein product [Peronospora belbahrii]